jgi:hypothetical protein
VEHSVITECYEYAALVACFVRIRDAAPP